MKLFISEGCPQSKRVLDWLQEINGYEWIQPMDIDNWIAVAEDCGVDLTPAASLDSGEIVIGVNSINQELTRYVDECKKG